MRGVESKHTSANSRGKEGKEDTLRRYFIDRLLFHCEANEVTRLGVAAIYANVHFECAGSFSPDIQHIRPDRCGHFQIGIQQQNSFNALFGAEAWNTDNQLSFFFLRPRDSLYQLDYDELMRALTLPEYNLSAAIKAICIYFIRPEGDLNIPARYALGQMFLDNDAALFWRTPAPALVGVGRSLAPPAEVGSAAVTAGSRKKKGSSTIVAKEKK